MLFNSSKITLSGTAIEKTNKVPINIFYKNHRTVLEYEEEIHILQKEIVLLFRKFKDEQW